jgi:hypothetical protein
MQSSKRTALAVAAGLTAAVVVVASLTSQADPDPASANRYPYDPVCAWGRVADGKGMLVRCLTESESSALEAGNQPAPAASRPPLDPADAALPSDAGDAGPLDASKPPPDRPISVSLGPLKVETGALPGAIPSLNKVRSRYEECVQKHGGLTKASGEVQVRFLVRARGRAEGSTVAKRDGVSQQAAQCIADVVDRRYVGLPEAPIVGATLIFKLERK